MSYIVDRTYQYYPTNSENVGTFREPSLNGVKAGDLLLMMRAINDDNMISIDDAGRTEVPGTNPGNTYCEVRAFYKFATVDDEQTSARTCIYMGIPYLHTMAVRGVDQTTPFADTAFTSFTAGANTIVRYPQLVATANNQLAIYLSGSDGDNITYADHTALNVRTLETGDDSGFYSSVIPSGVVSSFEDSVPSDQTVAFGIIFNDDAGTTLEPLQITPIKALENIAPDSHNNHDWKEIIYGTGIDPLTGTAREVLTPELSYFGNNQRVIRVDQASSMSGCTSGDALSFANGDTGNFARYDQYSTGNGGRGYLIITNYSGSGVPDNNVCTCGVNTCQTYGTGSSYQRDMTGWIRSDIKITEFGTYKSNGYSSIGLTDGVVYFGDLHAIMNSDNEGYWYDFRVADNEGFLDSATITPLAAVATGTFDTYSMLSFDYTTTGDFDYPRPAISGTYGWNKSIVGACRAYTGTKDMSDELLGIWSRVRNVSGSYAVFFLAIDSSDNWKVWKLWSRSDTERQNVLPEFATIELDGTETVMSSYGTLDSSNIKYYGILGQASGITGRDLCYTYEQYFTKKQTIIGGGERAPIQLSHIKKLLSSEKNDFGAIYDESLLSMVNSQFVYTKDLVFGDGASQCHIRINGQALSLPTQANGTTEFMFNVDGGTVGLEINESEGDIKNSLVSADVGGYINSISDNVDYSGTIFSKYKATLQENKVYENITFVESERVDLSNGAGLEGCVINGSTETGTTGGVLIDSSDTPVLKDTIIKNCVGYGMRIEGNTDVDFDNMNFDSNGIKDLYFSETTGSIHVNIINNTYVPTFDTAGVAVTISAPPSGYNLSMPNIIDGSRYQVYNLTQGRELANNTVSGGTGLFANFINGTDFAVGDEGRFRVTYCDGTDAKLGIEGVFTFPAGNNTNVNPVAQHADTVYNDNNIDGSSVTEFIADFPNVEIDVNDPDNVTTPQRIYAWYINEISTAGGIELRYGGLFAEDDVNYRVITDILDLHIQNTSAAALAIIGARIYRDDFTTILIAGNGPIQIDPLKAYIAPEVIQVSRELSFEGAVRLDVDNGTDDTSYPYGTQGSPCKTLANALVICSTHNISTIQLAGTLTLGVAVDGKEFISWKNGKINLNGQSCTACRFRELKVRGVQATVAMFYDCRLDDLQTMQGVYEDCKFLTTDTHTVAADAQILLNNCVSQIPGGHMVEFDCSNGGVELDFRNITMGLSLIDYDDVTNGAQIGFNSGMLVLDSTCTAGVIYAGGAFGLTDNSGAGCTVNLDSKAGDFTAGQLLALQ